MQSKKTLRFYLPLLECSAAKLRHNYNAFNSRNQVKIKNEMCQIVSCSLSFLWMADDSWKKKRVNEWASKERVREKEKWEMRSIRFDNCEFKMGLLN